MHQKQPRPPARRTEEQTSQPRRSTRVRKAPGWHDDYAMPHKAL